jgi:hypothetical protein
VLITHSACNALKKTTKKLIVNEFRSSIVIDCVRKLLPRHWSAWQERHCVFTAGGERVKLLKINIMLV